MKKQPKKFFKNLYDKLFKKNEDNSGKRHLQKDPETGKLTWSEGESSFSEEKVEDIKIDTFHLYDDEKTGTRTIQLVVPATVSDVFRKNRFAVEFPGIPSSFFSSYSYIGTDVYSQKKLLTSSKVISEDYSVFKVVLFVGGEIDICEKLKELEENPQIGNVKVHMLAPDGEILKTILIPDCEVAEIKAFRELEYGKFKDKGDDILFGEIVVKHKQRKLL
ncbi:MAG: hypothetical protein AABY15_05545 [Nanoarchaeota archaeon]